MSKIIVNFLNRQIAKKQKQMAVHAHRVLIFQLQKDTSRLK